MVVPSAANVWAFQWCMEAPGCKLYGHHPSSLWCGSDWVRLRIARKQLCDWWCWGWACPQSNRNKHLDHQQVLQSWILPRKCPNGLQVVNGYSYTAEGCYQVVQPCTVPSIANYDRILVKLCLANCLDPTAFQSYQSNDV